ncbi:DUF1704 domain-containing protein [Candidatus Woesearchaeota archaeon]|nr:DUF1704 domain-containing protein [Candidatus Woesearchaeota archaeon]MBW3022122.1 DUF1704 domain-containing protein [Candidatus Woesearchaeota archaeon]
MDKETLHADYMLDSASRKLSFLYINPINTVNEKLRCFQDPGYNPQFRYRKIRFSLELMKKRLKRLKIPPGPYQELLEQAREHCLDKVKMLKYLGTPKFTKYCIKVYGKPSTSLLKKARELIELPILKEKNKLTPDKYIPMLQKALEDDGLKDWRIKKVNGLGSSAYVNISDKTVMLRRGQNFSENYVKRLIVHEIGSHVLRAENGIKQQLKIFSSGFPHYMATEEGLAVVNEERRQLLDNETLKKYAGRVIATDMALRHPFSEIYTYMLKYFPRMTAYKIAMRAKRGISDTSQPGGCTKDHVYLKGYLMLKKFVKKGGDLNKLYYGKISLESLPMVEKFPDLVEPRLLLK